MGKYTTANRAICRAVVAYLALVLALTPLTFLVIFPLATRLLSGEVADTGWVHALASRLPQYVVYGLICGLFYAVVVRPLRLCPVLPVVGTPRRSAAIACCAAAAFLLMTPVGVLVTPNAVGFLTFTITGVSEEWIFRGVLTRVVAERAGIWWATAIVSAAFALWHWGEIVFVDRQQLFSGGWFAALGSDFLFAVIFTVIVWRSRSIVWGGLMHCLGDWKPWLYDHAYWINTRHVPEAVLIYAVGLAGAEVIRRSAPDWAAGTGRGRAIGAETP